MAQDITQKQQSYVQRYAAACVRLMDDLNALAALKSEWDANGFATGAPTVDGTAWAIPDAQVQAVLPAATASMLNTAVGAIASIQATAAANLGYLVAMRP